MERFLIVDSDDLELDFIRALTEEEIENKGEVLIARTGREALSIAGQQKPDAIIMDVQLAESDGMKILGSLREMYPNVIITILTACTEFDVALKALKYHVHDYMLKPVKPGEYKAALKDIRNIIGVKRGAEMALPKIPSHDGDDRSKDHQKKSFIEDSVEYIREHYRERIKLSEVASRVYMNTQYFSRVFKREMGVSFTEYVNILKINYACKLLETTNYPAYRIASECGFTDPSYFNRVFCLYMKMTPQKYKKQYRISKNESREEEMLSAK